MVQRLKNWYLHSLGSFLCSIFQVDDNYANAHLLKIERRKGGGGEGAAAIYLPDVTPSSIPWEHVWVIAMTDIENLDDTNLMES